MSPEMKSNLSIVCAEVDKRYGKGSIMTLNEPVVFQPDDVIDTGSIKLNLALGIGGYKKGRIIEIFGENSSGKTTLCLHACANVQKLGKIALFLDVEHSFDPGYAASLGVDMDKLLIAQPSCGEEALGIAQMMVRSGEVGLIIVDSVAALVPQKELEGDIGDSSIGVQARMMSQAMRVLVGPCSETGTTIIFTNQTRNKIGIIYGSPDVTSGGKALAFYASQRLKVSRTGDLKRGEEITGNKTKVVVVKNKCASPKKEAEFDIVFGRGVDGDGEIIELAASDGIIEKSGAWFKYEGNSIAQGSPNAIRWLNENPEIKANIRKQILESRGIE
jgi:recombination protein RecA